MMSSSVPISDILPYTQIISSGGQSVYSTNWTANYTTDVEVFYTPSGSPPDDATQLLNSSQYSVAFIGGSQTVQVTLVTPANSGDIVTITRNTPASRANLYTNTNFTPSMLNNDFGILTLVDQQAQLVNQLIGPRYNYSAVITDVVDTILPILGANQVWVKNSGNTAIVPVTLTPSGSITGTINVGSANQLAYYATNGVTISGLGLTQGLSIVSTNLEVGQANNIQFNNGIGFQDSNTNSLLLFSGLANAVNYINITNAPTATAPTVSAAGSDTNIPLGLLGKGTSGVNIRGDSSGNSGPAGYVGEVIFSVVLAANAVSCTSTVTRNITSILLTPGDWDIWGNIATLNGAQVSSVLLGGISTTSATPPNSAYTAQINDSDGTLANIAFCVPGFPIQVAVNTTFYLIVNATFASSTCTACGGIYARRRR